MYITTNEELKNLCDSLLNAKFISIDTEFSRKTTYYSQLCLIQIAHGDSAAIIDALSPNLNLFLLNDILQNPSIVKVLHSAKQDLEILFVLNGMLPQNIFDTQIAASFCGFGESISYELLVEKLLGCKIDKSYCLSDWTKRPLLKEQLNYAIKDVTYLYDLYPELISRLKDNDRLFWALDEMCSINKVENFLINPEYAWRKLKNNNNFKINLITKKLSAWRELKAQQFNVPRNHYLDEKHIFKLAEIKPISLMELRKIKYFEKVSEQEAEEILLIIQNALEQQIQMDLDDSHSVAYPKVDHQLFKKLKSILISCSDQYHLPPSLIATTEDLKELSILSSQVKLSNKALRGWRKEIFGNLALKARENII